MFKDLRMALDTLSQPEDPVALAEPAALLRRGVSESLRSGQLFLAEW